VPSRALFWLTVFFMLGISADRLFGESLPVQTNFLAFAAVILIAAMATDLWFRRSNANPLSPQSMIRLKGFRLKGLKPSVFLLLQPDFLRLPSSVLRLQLNLD